MFLSTCTHRWIEKAGWIIFKTRSIDQDNLMLFLTKGAPRYSIFPILFTLSVLNKIKIKNSNNNLAYGYAVVWRSNKMQDQAYLCG